MLFDKLFCRQNDFPYDSILRGKHFFFQKETCKILGKLLLTWQYNVKDVEVCKYTQQSYIYGSYHTRAMYELKFIISCLHHFNYQMEIDEFILKRITMIDKRLNHLMHAQSTIAHVPKKHRILITEDFHHANNHLFITVYNHLL